MKYLILIGVLFSIAVNSEEVYDSLSRDYLDIESDNPIAEGEDFEYWDEGSRSYHSGTIIDSDEADLYDGTFRVQDNSSGDIRTFELEEY